MKNPWSIIGARFVHPEDDAYLRRHNRTAKSSAEVHLQIPPLPYVGNPLTARVILLGKNPSYSEVSEEDMDKNPALIDEGLKALTFESEYPIFYLDPRFEGTNGYRWWNDALKELIAVTEERHGVDRDTVISRVAAIQWHAYHTRRSFAPKEELPTQAFNFDMVRQGIAAKKKFVIQYGAVNERAWRAHLPELPADVITLKNPQTPNLSRGNMTPASFDLVVDLLGAPDSAAE